MNEQKDESENDAKRADNKIGNAEEWILAA